MFWDLFGTQVMVAGAVVAALYLYAGAVALVRAVLR